MDPLELRRLLGDWRAGNRPAYLELAGAIADLIEAGHVEAGARLPAERRVADAVSVSRNTVIAAYGVLREDGSITTRRGSGSVVAPRGALSPRAARIAGSLTPNGVFDGFLSPQEDRIDLRAGYWIGTEELPPDLFDLTADPLHQRVLTESGYYPRGLDELRAAIADRLTQQGLETSPEDVIVTSGAQQALALLVSLLVDPGDPVLVEESTYPGMIDLLRAYGAHVHAMRRHDHGPDPTDLRRRLEQLAPRLVYLVLTGHNPTGTVAPPRLRDTLAQLLDQDVVVIDDVSLADTTIAEPPPPLAAYARLGSGNHIITVGSLSKSLWGGLRIGWVRAPRPLLDRLAHLKTIHDIGTPAPAQVIATRLLEQMPSITGRRREAVRRRRERLEMALRQAAPEWTWRTPDGGLSLWIDMHDINAVDFCAHASRFGVELAPGTISSPTAQFADHLRLPFGQPDHVLDEAVRRISYAWTTYRPSTRLSLLL